MCGEHHVGRDHAGRPGGSSPHVRGAQVQGRVPVQGQGIIPACAGSTGCRWPPAVRSWDHPRMCGEHHYLLNDDISSPGSSPHVRGAPTRSPPDAPASRDHPRMCGEHRRRSVAQEVVPGIIPACAGSTLVWGDGAPDPPGSSPHVRGAPTGRARPWASARDHPRMCGEHQRSKGKGAHAVGSSPHVRGAQLLEFLHVLGAGIIPACAGRTEVSWTPPVLRAGSSPHVRGAPCCRTAFGCRRRDHPRMCGEHERPAVL